MSRSEYVAELRSILLATGVSDAKMEEGSMRVDANVSVRRAGDPELGLRCEIKNMNSTRSLGRAIEYEARRQADQIVSEARSRAEALDRDCRPSSPRDPCRLAREAIDRAAGRQSLATTALLVGGGIGLLTGVTYFLWRSAAGEDNAQSKVNLHVSSSDATLTWGGAF